jgi:PAS domain S-box-containing protein
VREASCLLLSAVTDTGNACIGIVLTFAPIDQTKLAEQRAEEAMAYFEAIVETVREPLVVLKDDLTVRSANRSFYDTYKVGAEDVEGKRIYEIGDGQWDIPQLRKLLDEVLPNNQMFTDFSVEHEFPKIGYRRFLLNARRLRTGSEVEELILLAMEDVTEQDG